MCELEGEAAKSLHQGDLALDEEVGTLALEDCMLLLLQHKDHITFAAAASGDCCKD